jgi:hypothetical protein
MVEARRLEGLANEAQARKPKVTLQKAHDGLFSSRVVISAKGAAAADGSDEMKTT